jgi:hypothetical protein
VEGKAAAVASPSRPTADPVRDRDREPRPAGNERRPTGLPVAEA